MRDLSRHTQSSQPNAQYFMCTISSHDAWVRIVECTCRWATRAECFMLGYRNYPFLHEGNVLSCRTLTKWSQQLRSRALDGTLSLIAIYSMLKSLNYRSRIAVLLKCLPPAQLYGKEYRALSSLTCAMSASHIKPSLTQLQFNDTYWKNRDTV